MGFYLLRPLAAYRDSFRSRIPLRHSRPPPCRSSPSRCSLEIQPVFMGCCLELAFSTLLISQQASIFVGLMSRTFGFVTDTPQPDLWIVDPAQRFWMTTNHSGRPLFRGCDPSRGLNGPCHFSRDCWWSICQMANGRCRRSSALMMQV